MDFLNWLMFLGAALFIALTPGPGVLLAVSNSAKFGVRPALTCATGNVIGLFFVSTATMIGLGAILKSSAIIFTLVKALGALYLIYLGIRQWKSKVNVFSDINTSSNKKAPSHKNLLLQGLLVAATNPKALIFLTALFPQFIKTDRPIAIQFLILTFTLMMCTFISHLVYVYLTHHAKGWLSSNQRAKTFNRLTGGIFMLFGVGMLRLKNNQS